MDINITSNQLSIKAYLQNPLTRSLGILFAINAILFSNWAVRIPDVKIALSLSDADLGWALLASPLGVVVSTPIVAYLLNRFGPGKVSFLGACCFAFSIALISFPSSFQELVVALFVLGIANGSMDISMNTLASSIEKETSTIIMSMTHGFWSLTAMGASLIAGLIAGRGIPYTTHFLFCALLALVILLVTVRQIHNIQYTKEPRFKWQWPGITVFLLIIIAFIVFLVEGGIMDWNSLFYTEVLSSPVSMMGFGFAAFSFTMAIARFYGDRLFARFKAQHIVAVGCLIVSIGVYLFSLGHSIILSTAAMALTGLGCSILIPILFREAGLLPGVPPSLGIASVSTFGYTGFLAGPPIIGFISEAYSLQTSFFFLAIVMLGAVIISLFLKI